MATEKELLEEIHDVQKLKQTISKGKVQVQEAHEVINSALSIYLHVKKADLRDVLNNG